MELANVGTLSTLSHDGWPLGVGVRFAVDHEGIPVLSLNAINKHFSFDPKATLHVQVPSVCVCVCVFVRVFVCSFTKCKTCLLFFWKE